MTELESLRAEKEGAIRANILRLDEHHRSIQRIDARIAELEREPQRWRPKIGDTHWMVTWAGGTARSVVAENDDTNAFPTEARAQQVATHFRRLGLAAQWGALLTDEAMDNDAHQNGCWANGRTWTYYFPTAAQRDGFMADAKREGLL